MTKHPPYHLRPNKAVDRLAFLDAIRRLASISSLKEYTYYGLGGPYLEEFRLLYEFCPEIKMVSIEEDGETIKRQHFHVPCAGMRIEEKEFSSFLISYSPEGAKSIFWMDYTDLDYSNFDEFMALLPKLSESSLVKISVRADAGDYRDKEDKEKEFIQKFGAILPDQTTKIPRKDKDFASLLQKMLQIAAQKALSSALEMRFQPISSFYYRDTVGMFTLTGIVCKRGDNGRKIKDAYKDWDFANLYWGSPKEISLPVLSTKERLFLQDCLPCTSQKVLNRKLGYSVGNNLKDHKKLLKQYAVFHRYFPLFMKVNP